MSPSSCKSFSLASIAASSSRYIWIGARSGTSSLSPTLDITLYLLNYPNWLPVDTICAKNALVFDDSTVSLFQFHFSLAILINSNLFYCILFLLPPLSPFPPHPFPPFPSPPPP